MFRFQEIYTGKLTDVLYDNLSCAASGKNIVLFISIGTIYAIEQVSNVINMYFQLHIGQNKSVKFPKKLLLYVVSCKVENQQPYMLLAVLHSVHNTKNTVHS
jgi:hypothetical protein